MRGILYKCTLPRNPRSSRLGRIDEADSSALAAVNQLSTNCLEEAVRSFTAMLSRCRSSCADVTFRHPLPVFRVVRYSSVYCFQTRITLWNCSAAYELYCPIGKSSISRANNPPRSNSVSCWNFSLFLRGGILRSL
ncbi:uncharacterized protein TNCV_3580811 [Trichonephila clavipes]|nr:uncharacterized protein TNCV_3580811 [Trichonephila clavipes]